MSITGTPDGEPMKVGVAVADVVCGLYACTAVLAALQHRTRTGEGQYIDIGLADTQVAWLINNGTNYLTSGQPPQRLGNEHPNIVPYQVFATIDGHIIVAAGNDAQYARFCDVIGRADLAKHADYLTNVSRVKHRNTLIPILASEIAKLTKAELVSKMEQHGVPGGSINTLPEVFDSEQVSAREMKISMPHTTAKNGMIDLIGNPVKFEKTPVSYRNSPPTCGEHNDEITAELLSNHNSKSPDEK
jgi:crotonobetainyl-CoA:carnitine CoA-transferase CaiB-like acyl-CoA transferase